MVESLLDATFHAALATAWPRQPVQPRDAVTAYAGALCGSLATTRSTPPALRTAAVRFNGLGIGELAALCLRKADEETGHDALVLADLETLGITEALAEEVASRWAHQLAWAHHDFAARSRPLGVLGWMYALERCAGLVTRAAIDVVQALVPRGLDVTRARRIHCATGDDARHVAELVAPVAALAPADRRRVADAVGLVVPLIVGAAFDPAPAERLEASGWRLRSAQNAVV